MERYEGFGAQISRIFRGLFGAVWRGLGWFGAVARMEWIEWKDGSVSGKYLWGASGPSNITKELGLDRV